MLWWVLGVWWVAGGMVWHGWWVVLSWGRGRACVVMFVTARTVQTSKLCLRAAQVAEQTLLVDDPGSTNTPVQLASWVVGLPRRKNIQFVSQWSLCGTGPLKKHSVWTKFLRHRRCIHVQMNHIRVHQLFAGIEIVDELSCNAWDMRQVVLIVEI